MSTINVNTSNLSNTATVVLNDTLGAPTAENAVVFVPSVSSHDAAVAIVPTVQQTQKAIKVTYAAIEQLVDERMAWQDNAFRTSNEALYALLQKCYGLYKSMESGTAEGVALREGLNFYIETKGYNFTKATHTLTKIVKCVFGTDRRRVSTYSIVLRSALANRVSIFEVVDFIRNAGGVEEIRLAKSPNAMSAKQKAQVAGNSVVANNFGFVSSPALSGMLDAGKVNSNIVLIGTWQADGSVLVRAVVESETVLTAALASHYSTVKKAAEAQAAEAKAAADAEGKKQAINAALASASVVAVAATQAVAV
jgi:hypothetical protein